MPVPNKNIAPSWIAEMITQYDALEEHALKCWDYINKLKDTHDVEPVINMIAVILKYFRTKKVTTVCADVECILNVTLSICDYVHKHARNNIFHFVQSVGKIVHTTKKPKDLYIELNQETVSIERFFTSHLILDIARLKDLYGDTIPDTIQALLDRIQASVDYNSFGFVDGIQRPFNIKCSECDFIHPCSDITVSKRRQCGEQIDKHMRTNHSDIYQPHSKVRCPYCRVEQIGTVQDHMNTQHSDILKATHNFPIYCSSCDKKVNTSTTLENDTHEGESYADISYCSSCDEKFNNNPQDDFGNIVTKHYLDKHKNYIEQLIGVNVNETTIRIISWNYNGGGRG